MIRGIGKSLEGQLSVADRLQDQISMPAFDCIIQCIPNSVLAESGTPIRKIGYELSYAFSAAPNYPTIY